MSYAIKILYKYKHGIFISKSIFISMRDNKFIIYKTNNKKYNKKIRRGEKKKIKTVYFYNN